MEKNKVIIIGSGKAIGVSSEVYQKILASGKMNEALHVISEAEAIRKGVAFDYCQFTTREPYPSELMEIHIVEPPKQYFPPSKSKYHK